MGSCKDIKMGNHLDPFSYAPNKEDGFFYANKLINDMNINISYYNKGVYLDRKTGKMEPRRVRKGEALQVEDLKTVWMDQEKIDPNSIKGAAGMIFPLDHNIFYGIEEIRKNDLTSNGVVFIDIDSGVEVRDIIFEKIEEINIAMCNNILGASKTRKGLHILCVSNPSTASEYAMRVFERLCTFALATKKITGIDLKAIDKALDACTFVMTQRLFLYYSPKVYWNDTACNIANLYDSGGVDESNLQRETRKNNLNKIKTEYPELWEKAYKAQRQIQDNDLNINIEADVTGVSAATPQGYIDHFQRWMLFDSLCCCYGNDKEELDRQWARCSKLMVEGHGHGEDFFNREPNRNGWFDIWKNAKDHYCSIKLLKEFGYDISTIRYKGTQEADSNAIEIPENEYLSYYATQIDNEFRERGRILVQAPTGAGKTTLMIELAKKHNAVILVPFNAMLTLYEQGSHGDIVIVGKGYHNEYTKEKPVCMIWDWAAGFDLTDRTVISDETHQWFFDRDYRDSAVKTIKKAKEWKKLICISATPAGEAEELGLYVMKFTKKRDAIPTRLVNVRYSGGYIRELIENREPGVNYVVFSDRNAMNLYQNFPEGCLLHSKKKDDKKFEDVMDKQMLNNSLTFCTAIAYNGLNFRNTGDYKVIVDIEIGSDTANKIIQAVGRLRNANILEVIVVLSGGGERQSVAEKVVDNKILKDIDEKYDGARVVGYDKRYTEEDSIEAMTAIEEYLTSHNTKPSIIRDLSREGYFTMQEELDDEKRSKLRALLKEAANLKFKEMVREHNGHIDEMNDKEIEDVIGNELVDCATEWRDKMLGLEDDVDIDWVKVLEGRKDKCMMDTIINEIRDIYNVCRLSDDQFNECYSNARCEEALNWKDEYGNTLSEQAKIKVRKRFANAHKIREQYEVVCNEYETTYEDGDPVERLIGDLLDSKVVSRRISKELKRKGGRKGGRKGKEIAVQDTDGKVLKFKTIKEAAEEFGVSNNTMRAYVKKGKFEIVVKVKKCVYQVVNQ